MKATLLGILISLLIVNTTAKLFLGPIIGKVTNTTARILLEFDKETNVTLTLKSSDSIQEVVRLFHQNSPQVIFLDNLRENTKYHIIYEDEQVASFKTLSSSNSNLNVVFLSCNDYRKSDGFLSLWSKLNQMIMEERVDYVFHIGDQIYTDNNPSGTEVYLTCLHLYSNKTLNWVEECERLIKDLYINTWQVPDTARVLSSVPNMMMFDDHDIYDDFGWKYSPDRKTFDLYSYYAKILRLLNQDKNQIHNFGLSDSIMEQFDYQFSLIARKMYYLYQKQLRVDIFDINNDNYLDNLENNEFFSEILNGVGFYFFNYRAHRYWPMIKDLTGQLGVKQTKNFIETFSKNGKFDTDNIITGVLVGTIPFVLRNYILSKVSSVILDDYQEMWSYIHEQDLIAILEIVRKWKEKLPVRNLLLIGGDLHMGGHTDIYYKEEHFATQMVTSGINQSLLWIDGKLMDFMNSLEYGKLGKSDYYFYHKDWKNYQNFGLVNFIYNNDTNSFLQQTTLITKDKEAILENIHQSPKKVKMSMSVFNMLENFIWSVYDFFFTKAEEKSEL